MIPLHARSLQQERNSRKPILKHLLYIEQNEEEDSFEIKECFVLVYFINILIKKNKCV